MLPLPVDHILPELVSALRAHPAVVLEAPPGAGKTTRVPRALLDAGFAAQGEILVLEPRRLATRLSARRVADELGERLGERIGYQIRFEEVASAKTCVRFITEGLLTRRLASDPELRGVSVVLLDEFHERHIHTDLALALVRRLQRGARPDLKLVVMSATLDGESVARFLSAPLLRSEGKRFEVSIEHLPRPDERPLGAQVAASVRRLVQDGLDGDVLVFLPGAAEIRRSHEALSRVAQEASLEVVTLHGDLSAEEQDRAIRPSARRKVILSTNVAETSVTIEGVVAVIDSGLARVASHAPWSGLPQLKLQRIAQAAAKQRAGRAGRLREGRCLRLYTQHDFSTRPAYEQPELLRMDLAEATLLLHAFGLSFSASFELFEAPSTAAVEAARQLLERLGALSGGRLTPLGTRMARMSAHPRQARLLLEAEARGLVREGATIAALLSEREIVRERKPARSVHESDLLMLLELFERAEADNLAARTLESLGLDVGAAHAVRRQREQLLRQLARTRGDVAKTSSKDREDALLTAILCAYPDRVCRRRRGREVVFAPGRGSGELSEQSAVHEADWLVAIDAEERTAQGQRKTVVRLASAIATDWLLELFTDRITDAHEVEWNDRAGRVEAFRRLRYDDFVIDESSDPSPDPARVAPVLAAAAKARGIEQLIEDREAFPRLQHRVAFLRTHCPELGLPPLDEPAIDKALIEACFGKKSLDDLSQSDLLATFSAALGPDAPRLLEEHAPERLRLPGGRRAPIEYPAGQPPHLSSRLQDFFGMRSGPRLAKGRVPLVIHLLAPNGRDVQVTTDLEGFWARHYPSIAKELRRRYPKHRWPDDPLTAEPPPAGRR